MFCKSCGKEIDQKINFCPYCGTNLQEDKNMTAKKVEKNKIGTPKNKYIVPAIIGVAAIGGLVLGGFGVTKLITLNTSSSDVSVVENREPQEQTQDIIDTPIESADEYQTSMPTIEATSEVNSEVADSNNSQDTVEAALVAYEEYYNNNCVGKNYTVRFAYIDDDDIPEMILQGNCFGNGGQLCTYYNGNISAVDKSYTYSYTPRKGRVLFEFTHGNIDEKIYKLDKGIWTKDIDIEGQEYKTNEGYIDFIYYINGQEVSYDEYNRKLDELLPNRICLEDTGCFDSIQAAYDYFKFNNE